MIFHLFFYRFFAIHNLVKHLATVFNCSVRVFHIMLIHTDPIEMSCELSTFHPTTKTSSAWDNAWENKIVQKGVYSLSICSSLINHNSWSSKAITV